MWIIIFSMIVFSVLHSLLAGQTLKQAARNRFGDQAYHGTYRLVYNLLAALLLVPAMAALFLFPGGVIWSVEGSLSLAFRALQLVGLVGLVVSLLQIDLGQFTGLSQLKAYLDGTPLPLPTEPLQVRGVYRLVRHPLYLFSLLVLWPMPTMTEAMLVFNIVSTFYFVFGSLLEERRLIAVFGEAYLDYRRSVPWLIPFVKRPRSLNSQLRILHK